ncbi:hypothetical protein ACE6H2_022886 [Prunus campanulata]
MTHIRETANDLIVIHKVALAEGLGGTTVHLIKLDGRDLPIPILHDALRNTRRMH